MHLNCTTTTHWRWNVFYLRNTHHLHWIDWCWNTHTHNSFKQSHAMEYSCRLSNTEQQQQPQRQHATHNIESFPSHWTTVTFFSLSLLTRKKKKFIHTSNILSGFQWMKNQFKPAFFPLLFGLYFFACAYKFTLIA